MPWRISAGEIERLRNDYHANKKETEPDIDIVATGGTESEHMRSRYCHENGYEIDLRKNGRLDSFIEKNHEKIVGMGDGAPQYKAPTGAIASRWEAGHSGGKTAIVGLDVLFWYTCRIRGVGQAHFAKFNTSSQQAEVGALFNVCQLIL